MIDARVVVAGLCWVVACGPQPASEDTGEPDGSSGASSGAAPTSGEPITGDPTTGAEPTTGAPEEPTGGSTCPPGQSGELLATTSLREPPGMVWAQSIALGPDGEAYLTGALWDGDITTPALARVARDGALLGLSMHQDIGPQGFSVGVVRASDGELLIAGVRGGEGEEQYIANFAADGAPIGLSPLPGESGRHIAALAIGPGDHLIVAAQDDANNYWLMSISPNGDVTWEVPTTNEAGGPSWLAVGPAGEVAVAHGQWNTDNATRAEVAFASADGEQGWGVLIAGEGAGEVGRVGGVALTPDLDLLAVTSRLDPVGQVVLRSIRASKEQWRTTIAEGDDARLIAHDLWMTPGGDVQVLITVQQQPAVDPISVSAHVIGVATDGTLLSTVALPLGLTPQTHDTLDMRAALDDCGALRIWDSPSRTLWSVQL